MGAADDIAPPPARTTPIHEQHHLVDDAQSIRVGRHFVEDRLCQYGYTRLADDGAVVAGELLANARQHARPPVTVAVIIDDDLVRIEVSDASPHAPVRPAPNLSNMTGRGLALVEALSQRWGFRREDGGGKTVWAELVTATQPRRGLADDDLDIDAVLAAWDDDPEPDLHRHTVVLGDVPTDLLIEAKAHVDNLVREFSLAVADGDSAVPEHLALLIDTVVNSFAEARVAIKRQALDAAREGLPRTRLVLRLPLSAAAAGEAYLRALDEADGYARAARLLTLETPPEHRLFRHWYVEAVITQLRAAAAGSTPTPAAGFDERLLAEVRRLSRAQRVSERTNRLQNVTAALASARTPEDVAGVVVSEGVAALGASGGSLLVPASDGQHLAVPGAVGYGEQLVDQFREEGLDAELPAATALRTGAAVWLESQLERDEQFPQLRGFEADVASMCAVPLVVSGRTIGALRFSFDRPRLFDADERGFVARLAAQTALTLQRAEVYQAELHAALELQRELLPKELPGSDAWDVAAHYSPADGQEAGGDFYDVVQLPNGRLAAFVGDVMGRGLQAAAAMAQIRSMIRAYVIDDPTPKAVFDRVDTYFAAMEPGQFVTVLYLLLDSDSDVVQVANAGHLSPLLVDSSGARMTSTAVGLPFGAGPDDRVAEAITVADGSSIVVVTDGLVERRGEDIDIGISRVVRAVNDLGDTDSATVLGRIRSSVLGEQAIDDDVTVLVLHRR